MFIRKVYLAYNRIQYDSVVRFLSSLREWITSEQDMDPNEFEMTGEKINLDISHDDMDMTSDSVSARPLERDPEAENEKIKKLEGGKSKLSRIENLPTRFEAFREYV